MNNFIYEDGQVTIKTTDNDSRNNIFNIFSDALVELQSARKRYPTWPDDIVHATVVMVEESTEVLKAANEVRWQHKDTTAADVRKEVIQTIAMCLRLLTETPGL